MLLITNLEGAETALKANVPATETLSWGGTDYTAAAIEGQIDGFVALQGDVETTEAAYQAALAAWKTARPEAEALWKTYQAWVKLTYGSDDATKKKFNVPVTPPAPKPTAEQKAVSNAKLRATLAKKKAAAQAAAPAAPSVVVYDASGNVIGGAPPANAPAAAPVPAAAKP